MACEFSLEQIVKVTGGDVLSKALTDFKGVGTDTRKDMRGQIFIALKGPAHDAHKYLAQAIEKGATCLIVHEEPPDIADLFPHVTVVKVRNTLTALQDLARAWRRSLPAKVVGITGSVGKTSVKEFAAAILAEQYTVHYSRESFNNHWGVPFTLLATPKEAQVTLVEMGMNKAGELTKLSKIAEPDAVICTTVARSHVGNFADGIQGIADAKEEIYLANPDAIQIFNYDNEYTNKMFERVHKLLGTEKTRAFSGFSAGADVSLRANFMHLDSLEVVGHIKGIKGEAKVSVFGRQNITNLMAACSIALYMGMEPELIWVAIKKCKGTWGRNQLHTLPSGTKVLFDAYNANPDSMAILIRNLFEIQCEGRKIAVLGEMAELGDTADKAHAEIGEMIGNTDFQFVWFMGPSKAAFETGFKNSGSSNNLVVTDTYQEELAKKVQSVLNPSDIVVIKASRVMELERVLKLWDPNFSTDKS